MSGRRYLLAWLAGITSLLVIGGGAAVLATVGANERPDRERVPAAVIGGTVLEEATGYRVSLTVDYVHAGQTHQPTLTVAPGRDPLATEPAAQSVLSTLLERQTVWVEHGSPSARHTLAQGAIMDDGTALILGGGGLLAGLILFRVARPALLEAVVLLVMNGVTAVWLSQQLIAADWSVDLAWGSTGGAGIYLPLVTLGAALYGGLGFAFAGSLHGLSHNYRESWRHSLWHLTGTAGFLLGIGVVMGLTGAMLAVVMDERALNALELGL
jgi:hypothetical protein